ncbi:MAG: hypothetical protein HKN25_02045 [Pyrinomonadaceae bacterium]|nr:hypothetical protein [Pyrinomonadaceae bacterium]
MERTRNFLLILFAVILVVSLIVFAAMPSRNLESNLTQSDDLAAEVGSKTITIGDLATLKQNAQVQIPSTFLVNNLIDEKLSAIEAERLGLTASDAEVAAKIREGFTPTDGRAFDQGQYEAAAARQAGSVAAYEESLRNRISRQKLIAYVTSGVTVSEEEILDKFKEQNTKFDLTYVPISTADVSEKITPSDDELKDYFEKNKKQYYISSPQKKIKYIYLETAKIGEKLTFTDEELKEEYEKLADDKKIAGVKVQEIVLRIPKPEEESQVMAKANQIVAELKKGKEEDVTVTEEAFAEVAKGKSEKPSTAQNGGRVSGLVRANPNNTSDPYQRILNMKEGEITEPLQFQSNIYVLRRGESVKKPFEQSKKELEVSRRNTKAYTANAALAQKVAERLKKEKDVEKVAEEFASEANSQKSEMIRETGYVVPGDEIDKLGISQDFEQGIATLETKNDVGDKIPIPGGFAVPLLADKKDPRDAEFDEVKSKVIEAVKSAQARDKVEEIATSIAKSANSAGSLKSAAAAEKFEAQTAEDFVLGSPLGSGPTAGTSEALQEAIFALKKGEVTKKPIKVGENWYVVGVNDRIEANMENFTKEREQLLAQNLDQKRSRVFLDYIAAVRQKMEGSGEIKIYKAAIEKLDEQLRQNQGPSPQTPQQQLQQQLQQQIQQQQQQAPPPPSN